jgi:hypothetical protein
MRFTNAVAGLCVLLVCLTLVALGVCMLVGWQDWREWPGWLMAIVFMGVGLAPLVVLAGDAWYGWWMAPGRAYMRRERVSFWLYRHGRHGLVRLLNRGHCYAENKDPGCLVNAICECGIESTRWHQAPCYLREHGPIGDDDYADLPF